jgi:hypothetical protein
MHLIERAKHNVIHELDPGLRDEDLLEQCSYTLTKLSRMLGQASYLHEHESEGEVKVAFVILGLAEAMRFKDINSLKSFNSNHCVILDATLVRKMMAAGVLSCGDQLKVLDDKHIFRNPQRRITPSMVVLLSVIGSVHADGCNLLERSFCVYPMIGKDRIPPITYEHFQKYVPKLAGVSEMPLESQLEFVSAAMLVVPDEVRHRIHADWILSMRKCACCNRLEPKMRLCRGCRVYALCGEQCQHRFWKEGGHSKECANKK